MRRDKVWLGIILFVALALRLVVALNQDAAVIYDGAGNDAIWYLANGYALASGFDTGKLPGYDAQRYPDGYPIALRSLPTPPLYLLFIGLPQMWFTQTGAVIAIWILQALLGTATCYFAYRLGSLIASDVRAGLIAAGVLAISPVLVLEAAQITTEMLYIFLVMAGLTVYVNRADRPAGLIAAAVLFGLATLTRAVLLLFPLGLVLHLLIVYKLRAGLKRAALLLLMYSLVVGTWTIYNLVRWNRWVIGGEGFAAFLYIGATEGGWEGPNATDEALSADGQLPTESSDQQAVYLNQAQAIISRDPVGYVTHRLRQLASAYLQPHGTLLFGGAALRELITDWLRTDRTLNGLIAVTQAPGFWPKLALYVFHYAGLILGIAGMWLTRRQWRLTLPLIGFILYTSLMHLVLDAIPRYIFPTTLCWWAFAGAALVALWQLHQKQSISQPVGTQRAASD